MLFIKTYNIFKTVFNILQDVDILRNIKQVL